MPLLARRAVVTASVLALTAASAACGDDGGGSGACGPIVRERVDPSYLVHVVGESTEADYLSDPPTSGAHEPGPERHGVLDDPLRRPVQVGILERGDILLQHEPDLPEGDMEVLRDLAGPHVVVAPNPDLPAPIVGTAWLHKLICQSADRDALQELIHERTGKGPDD